jgi:hypothetical protein
MSLCICICPFDQVEATWIVFVLFVASGCRSTGLSGRNRGRLSGKPFYFFKEAKFTKCDKDSARKDEKRAYSHNIGNASLLMPVLCEKIAETPAASAHGERRR